jgi:serine-type D-Ala-D-Ala carboxypeptidase/endopeptidase (penicillin-binding protein 4)
MAQSVLPVEVELLLRQARLPKESFAAVVQDVGTGRSRLALNPNQPMNPASLEKLLTTQAALELLGPAFSWSTPVWIDGTLSKDGVLDGRVIIKGTGDPKLVAERFWLLLQRLRQSGVATIRGDIVIDQSAFDIAEVAPSQFDNEPLRPYNARPQPLLVAQKSLVVTFTPQPGRGIANVSVLPPLAENEACGDWRSKLAPQWSEGAAQLRFTGALPSSCGERTWPMAHVDPSLYHPRVILSMWRELGGILEGGVRESRVRVMPTGVAPSFEFTSPPLAEVVRDINKFSNNTMAQQLFLTLSLQRRGTGTWAGSREVLRQWLTEQVKTSTTGLVVENGSGLSRESRLSANLLARVLQHAWRGPTMPDLMASLPASGVDGTMRRSQLATGRAHLKTGSLRDVAGVAGYVLGSSGKRYVVVAIANHEHAQAARPAIDALVQWVSDDSQF